MTEEAAVPPTPAGVDITPDKDGGVYKEIKVAGTGEDGPGTGDKVFVHYVGTLTDGSKFDSSRDRGDQFEFELGKGQVIKAWDIGVASMKRGEVAVLTCRYDYAYGESGSPPKIPPNATLIFEVELFNWKGEDLTTDKDGGVTRSIMKKGDGFSTPNEGASCEIHLKGKMGERQFEDRDVSFTVGEGVDHGLVEGVEIACKKMKKGEESKIQVSSKYAYGGEGNKEFNIPPNTDLVYEIEMKNFEKAKEKWEMDAGEKLEQGTILKEKGTTNFKAGNYSKAVRFYKKVVEFLEHEETLEGEEATKREQLLLAAHLNLAMCYLKLSNNIEARNECEEALKMDEKNEKAIFRKGTALMNLKEYDDAIADFKAVLELDANNKAAKNQITIATKKIREEKEREKKLYSGMFQKFASADNKANTAAEKTEEKKDESVEEKSEKTDE